MREGVVTMIVRQIGDELIINSRVSLIFFGKFDVRGKVVRVG